MSAGRKKSMIGYARVDKKKLNNWIQEQTEQINTKAQDDSMKSCWYTSLWQSYFYSRQEIYKNAVPVIEMARYGGTLAIDKSPEFISLMDALTDEGQRLTAYYADDTAAIVGHLNHKYILPAELVEVECLKDYSALTSGELAALGDKQMSEAMLPADMNGYSIKSLEDELAEEKQKISSAEEKCKAAIEEVRQEALRKEQELKELLAKETEKLRIMKEELENKLYVLDTQIYGIRCYLGEVVDFTQIRAGEAASKDTPVVMFQKMRFLDEEMGKYLSLYTFGVYEDDNETLIKALKVRDDLRDVFCPADRCITVLRNSRTGKAVKLSDKVANMLERYEYLHGTQIAILVRDGENLFIGWTDEDKIHISSDDMFLRPGVSVKEVADEEYGFGHRYWSEEEKIKAEKKIEKAAIEERISRYFLVSILQGMIDRGGLINIPQTRITEESDLVKFSFAEGWLKDTTYGTFEDILNRSKGIEIKKGEVVLTGMNITRDDTHNYGSNHSSEYAAFSNNRGIGEKNRTHGAHIPGFKLMSINKVLKESKVSVTFDLMKATTKVVHGLRFRDNANPVDVIKDPSEEVLGTYTSELNLDEDDFNAAGTLTNYKKVIISRFSSHPLWFVDEDNKIEAVRGHEVHPDYLPDLTKYGVPEIKDIKVLDEECFTYISVPAETWNGTDARVNFKIMPDEYIRTTYLCTTWLKYVVTTGNIGNFQIAGTRMSYAETLKYLNKLIEHTRKREEAERALLIESDGEEYIKSHSDWDRELCEWRIEHQIPTLTSRSAKKFLREKTEGSKASENRRDIFSKNR